METKENLLEPLLERVEEYSKTSFELLKLKTVDKTADVLSTIISRVVLIPVFLILIVTLSIASALLLGDKMGKLYYGFFMIAGVYLIICVVLFYLRSTIKTKVNNFIITQILK